jgi:hypothetical protein
LFGVLPLVVGLVLVELVLELVDVAGVGVLVVGVGKFLFLLVKLPAGVTIDAKALRRY